MKIFIVKRQKIVENQGLKGLRREKLVKKAVLLPNSTGLTILTASKELN